MANRLEELASALKGLYFKDPYYGMFAMGLKKSFSDDMPTMGVRLDGINYELCVGTKYWDKNPDRETRMALLRHELGHIIFNHPVYNDQFPNHEVYNIACDIEIHCYMDTSKLPGTPCTVELFPELEGKKRMGARWYYNKLMENLNNPSSQIGQMQQDGDLDNKQNNGGGSEQQNNGNDNSNSSGQLGSGQQKQQGQQSSDDDGGNQQCNKNGSSSKGNGRKNNVDVPQHNWEKTFDDLSDMTKEIVKQQVEAQIESIAKQVESSHGIGSVPGEIQEIIEKLQELRKSKFNWKGFIRRFVGSSRKTYTRMTRMKENKRIPDIQALKIKMRQKVLVGIDTSGSVSTEYLKEFLNEITRIAKMGYDIDILECDTQNHEPFHFDPRKPLPVFGRGGTDLQPVCDYYKERVRYYCCLVYFTDGEAYTPKNTIGNILWVMPSTQPINNDLPGKVIQIEF